MRLSLDWIETPEEARGLLGRWRESVVNGLLRAGVLLGIPFWVLRPIPLDQLLTPRPIAYLVLVVAALARRLPLSFRATALLGILYGGAINSLGTAGVVSAARLLLITMVVVTGLVVGNLPGLLAWLLSIATLVAAGALITRGAVEVSPPFVELSLSQGNWVSYIVTFAFASGLLLISTNYLLAKVTGVVVQLRSRLTDLEVERTGAKELRNQLYQAQRMKAVGQLAGGIAHDFNNLMAAVIGFAGLVQEDESLSDAVREDVKGIELAGQKAAHLTRQLLAFSSRQILDKEPVDLQAILNQSSKMLRSVIPERIELRMEPAGELPKILADSSQIEQVVMNLSLNARDSIEGSGTIRISSATCTVDDAFVIANPFALTGDFVRLCVLDTGSGVPEDALDRLFEPFYTTKPEGEGTGLGLAVVYGIVKQHGGFLEVKSRLGDGSEFYVYLPVAKQ